MSQCPNCTYCHTICKHTQSTTQGTAAGLWWFINLKTVSLKPRDLPIMLDILAYYVLINTYNAQYLPSMFNVLFLNSTIKVALHGYVVTIWSTDCKPLLLKMHFTEKERPTLSLPDSFIRVIDCSIRVYQFFCDGKLKRGVLKQHTKCLQF